MSTILVAGATGSLGRSVVSVLAQRGHCVIALTRRSGAAASLPGVAEERVGDALVPTGLSAALRQVDAVFSCLGASVMPSPLAGRATYSRVDTPANCNLVDAACDAGIDRFVYVGVAMGQTLGHLDYVRAHQRVVEHVRSRGLPHAVVNPTGFFSAFAPLVDMARLRVLPVIGDPEARTNPIHPEDLAEVCADAIDDQDFGERDVGGPQILTRAQIARLAFEAAGTRGRVVRVPAGLVRMMAAPMALLWPRLGHVMRFYAAVGEHDCLAASHGQRTLAEFFAALASPSAS